MADISSLSLMDQACRRCLLEAEKCVIDEHACTGQSCTLISGWIGVRSTACDLRMCTEMEHILVHMPVGRTLELAKGKIYGEIKRENR